MTALSLLRNKERSRMRHIRLAGIAAFALLIAASGCTIPPAATPTSEWKLSGRAMISAADKRAVAAVLSQMGATKARGNRGRLWSLKRRL